MTSRASVASFAGRLHALRAGISAAGVGSLLVTHPPNLRYLIGLVASMGMLLVRPDDAVLVVDGRYLSAARARAASGELDALGVELADPAFEETLARVVFGGPPIETLGIEAAHMTVSRFNRLSEALARTAGAGPTAAPRLSGTERLVERLRAVKDAGEQQILREAAARLSSVAAEVLPLVRPGRTEAEVAAQVDAALRRAGFERPAFETIVASGPNSALPHARPGRRVLAPSDGVVLDFGGIYDGYCVDLTRTVQLAPATARFRELFDAVRAAHRAAIAAVRPGVKTSAVDAAARNVLSGLGLGEAFAHGTGHGLGLEVHEEPRIGRAQGPDDATLLSAGMVFTIEPGAYLPGLGGVRIEDDVLVVAEGCEVLTDVPIDGAGT